MPFRRFAERTVLAFRSGIPVAAAGFLLGSSNVQKTNDLVWTMIAIGVAGSIVTFSFLVYAIWRFRDPKAKGRRYG